MYCQIITATSIYSFKETRTIEKYIQHWLKEAEENIGMAEQLLKKKARMASFLSFALRDATAKSLIEQNQNKILFYK
jgi:hypothetical protein